MKRYIKSKESLENVTIENFYDDIGRFVRTDELNKDKFRRMKSKYCKLMNDAVHEFIEPPLLEVTFYPEGNMIKASYLLEDGSLELWGKHDDWFMFNPLFASSDAEFAINKIYEEIEHK